MSRLFSENIAGQKGVAQYIQSTERKKKNSTKNTLPSKFLPFRIEGVRKSFPDMQKVKELITTKLALKEMLKDFF